MDGEECDIFKFSDSGRLKVGNALQLRSRGAVLERNSSTRKRSQRIDISGSSSSSGSDEGSDDERKCKKRRYTRRPGGGGSRGIELRGLEHRYINLWPYPELLHN